MTTFYKILMFSNYSKRYIGKKDEMLEAFTISSDSRCHTLMILTEKHSAQASTHHIHDFETLYQMI